MVLPKRHEELIVITKTYDLILWSCNHTGKFPRNHRFVLGERIERNLYDLLEILIRAKYTRQRQELLEKANLMLEILRFQMRLAKDLQRLKVESYAPARSLSDWLTCTCPYRKCHCGRLANTRAIFVLANCQRRKFGADNSPTRKSHKYEQVCHNGIFGTDRYDRK
jgi:hypothetical protein